MNWQFTIRTRSLVATILIVGVATNQPIFAIGEIHAPQQENKDPSPEEFGRSFGAVCKVGKRGGDGTLIEPKWIITAAHVARGMYKQTNGTLSVFFENHEYRVKSVFLHPKAKPMGRYDVALLELEKPVTGHTPFSIYRESDELGKQIIIAGHGDKRDEKNDWIKDGKLRAYTNKIDRVNEVQIVFDYDSPDEERTKMEGTSGPGDSGGRLR